MLNHHLFKPVISRFLLILAISVFFTFLFNEASYLLLKEKSDRAPQTIQLVIPAGTAKKIGNGEQNLSIPSEMIFVLGDVLEVKNNDNVSHQLGPIWVPPGATGSLVMEIADKFAYSCSFLPNKYLNLDVRESTTISTRIIGMLLAAPTLAVLLFLYSFLIFPIRNAQNHQELNNIPIHLPLHDGEN